MQLGFGGDRLQAAVGAMLEVIGDQAERWRRAHEDHHSVEIESQMTTLTLDLMATAMLGVRLSQQDLETTGRAFGVVLNHLGLRFATFTLPPSLHIPGEARPQRALMTLDGMVDRILERQTAARDDVFGHLLQAWRHGDITRRQLRDEVITLLFGGYEATAHALSWTWYLLDQHPDVGDRVREEAGRIYAR